MNKFSPQYTACIEAVKKYLRDNDLTVYGFAKDNKIPESTLHRYLKYEREATGSNLLYLLEKIGYKVEIKKGKGFKIEI